MIAKSKQKIIEDGHHAKRLMDDDKLQEFLDEIKASCHVEIEVTGFNDTQAREASYMKLKGVDHVRQALQAMIDNASIEKNGK